MQTSITQGGQLAKLLPKIKIAPDGCWNWQGTLEENNYGRVWFRGKTIAAHRAVWIASGHELADDLELDHLCRNHSCVNPAHLEPITHDENIRRKALAQTHCKHGHPLSGENLIVTNRQRQCRECRRRWSREREQRLKEAGYRRVGTRMMKVGG